MENGGWRTACNAISGGFALSRYSPPRSASEDDHVGTVAAKLRSAVQHAGLAAHQQVPDLPRRERRKDFANRVRDQVNLPRSNRMPTVSPSPATARAASGHTILASQDQCSRPYRQFNPALYHWVARLDFCMRNGERGTNTGPVPRAKRRERPAFAELPRRADFYIRRSPSQVPSRGQKSLMKSDSRCATLHERWIPAVRSLTIEKV